MILETPHPSNLEDRKKALQDKFPHDIDGLKIAEAQKMVTSRTEDVLIGMFESGDQAQIREAKSAIYLLHDNAFAFITFDSEVDAIVRSVPDKGENLYQQYLTIVREKGPNAIEEISEFCDQQAQHLTPQDLNYLKAALAKYTAQLSINMEEFNDLPLLKAALAKVPA